MVDPNICNEVSKVIIDLKANGRGTIDENLAFSFVSLKFYFSQNTSIYSQLEEYITDGANDGGIDFVFFSEEEDKLYVC